MKLQVYLSNTLILFDESYLRRLIPENPNLELCAELKKANVIVLHRPTNHLEAALPPGLPEICLGCQCDTKDLVVHVRSVNEVIEILNFMANAVLYDRQVQKSHPSQ